MPVAPARIAPSGSAGAAPLVLQVPLERFEAAGEVAGLNRPLAEPAEGRDHPRALGGADLLVDRHRRDLGLDHAEDIVGGREAQFAREISGARGSTGWFDAGRAVAAGVLALAARRAFGVLVGHRRRLPAGGTGQTE